MNFIGFFRNSSNHFWSSSLPYPAMANRFPTAGPRRERAWTGDTHQFFHGFPRASTDSSCIQTHAKGCPRKGPQLIDPTVFSGFRIPYSTIWALIEQCSRETLMGLSNLLIFGDVTVSSDSISCTSSRSRRGTVGSDQFFLQSWEESWQVADPQIGSKPL